jgi:hypothetical protein
MDMTGPTSVFEDENGRPPAKENSPMDVFGALRQLPKCNSSQKRLSAALLPESVCSQDILFLSVLVSQTRAISASCSSTHSSPVRA